MDGNGSVLCSMVGFGISGVEASSSVTNMSGQLVRLKGLPLVKANYSSINTEKLWV
jgi:hypothetical protein